MKIGIIRMLLTALSFCSIALSGMAAEVGGSAPSSTAPQMQELQERMVGDPGMLALIDLLRNDPDMQALLSDPKVLEAVQAGDVGALLQNPRFIRILNDPRVQEIEKRLDNQEDGRAK